jgi:flavin reductase (DIM6/NTAB) family NADH-FMN oxidoreductase RutF
VASHVFYICPRPVVLVSVEHEGSGNLFPMDLIGPTDSPWFSMALRSTSPAVRLMQQSRRMALASIPFGYQGIAYELGKHHKLANIDWAALPFATVRSQLFNLRVPEAALRLREVSVQEFHEVGSHVLFLTSVERETIPGGAKSPQLFHAFESYRRYLARRDIT